MNCKENTKSINHFSNVIRTRSFTICTTQQILFRWSNQEEWDGWGT